MISYTKIGLSNTKKMFEVALNNKFAVPGYNASNLEQFQAILTGCGETNSPAIIQINPISLNYAQPVIIKHLVKGFVELCNDSGFNIPIALHLDHGNSFEICRKCIDIGFSSVMIDGSHLEYEENIKITKRVVQYAKERKVSVEAELGIVSRPEKDKEPEKMQYTDPDQAAEFINRTGCNSLAIAIGTSHGAYKFNVKDESEIPELRFDILRSMNKKLGKFPIVLHGASSVLKDALELINLNGGKIQKAFGIPEAQLHKASKSGICKINIATDSRLLFTAMVRKYLNENPEIFDPRKYLGFARQEIKNMIKRKNKEVLNSAQKAKLII